MPQDQPSQFNLKLGDEVRIPDPSAKFKAVVTGIDRYTEKTAAGGVNTWVSYTLDSDAPEGNPWKHFWAVDGQAPKQQGEAYLRRSFYIASQKGDQPPEGFVLDRNLSGYVELRSEGNAELSGGAEAQGALFTYRNKAGEVWAEENFVGADRLTFDAIFE